MDKYIVYFNTPWKKYLSNSILNYKLITKIQLSNSFIENFSRHIRDELNPYLNRKGTSIIS